MSTGLCILLAVIVAWIIVVFLAIKFDSVEVDPNSPFFEDEIRSYTKKKGYINDDGKFFEIKLKKDGEK